LSFDTSDKVSPAASVSLGSNNEAVSVDASVAKAARRVISEDSMYEEEEAEHIGGAR